MENLFFENWTGLFRVGITTILSYLLLIIILRVFGKRTLAKMNAFDFVVTIALGSILSSVILNKDIPLLEGMLALGLLIGLQFCLTFISVRNKKFKKLISSKPTLLFYKGELLNDVLKSERVSIQEVNKAVRTNGFSNFDKIQAVVLEPTGDISIIKENDKEVNSTTLQDVENYREKN